MAAVDSLIQAQTNIATQLAAVTANPKPSYSIDGKTVSWTEYQAMLIQQLETLAEQIQTIGGPFEVRSVGA